MSSQKFDPFSQDQDDAPQDDLEFSFEGEGPRERTVIEHMPVPARQSALEGWGEPSVPEPKRAAKPLRISFEEVDETGAAGGAKVGADGLEAGEFLKGLKKQANDEALAKALAQQRLPAQRAVDAGRVITVDHKPMAMMVAGAVVFVVLLLVGVLWMKSQHDEAELARKRGLLSEPAAAPAATP